MKKFAALAFLVMIVFSSCVSKKKFTEANDLAEKKAAEKAVLEEVLNKLAVENDSLNKLVALLDSLYRGERDRSASGGNRVNEKAVKLKLNKKLISGKEEYSKKAIFIYNFISYISWPSDLKEESFNIGIVGESQITVPLAGYLQGKSVNNLPVTVETYQPNKNYHILFFSESGSSNFNKIKKLSASKPVLLITENVLLEKIGSHISLYVDGAKVKYSVNKNVLEKTRLKASEAFYSLSDK